MAQPQPYNRQFNFADQQALTPSSPLPGVQVDAELNSVKLTLDQTLANLAKVQRDDGALKNGIVTQDSLAPSLSIGFTFRGAWAEGVNYLQSDGASIGSIFYRAKVSHLSTAGNSPAVDTATWEAIANITPIGIDVDSIYTDALQNGAVTSPKLANGAVSEDKIGTGAVATGKLADGVLSANSTGRAKMADGFVTEAKIADDAVTEAKIADEAVTFAKVQDIATARALGRVTGGTGPVEELTGAQLTTLVSAFVGDAGSGGTKGAVPAPAAGDAAARRVLGAGGGFVDVVLRGHIFGLILANNATDAANDVDIAAGECASSASSPINMIYAGQTGRQLDVAYGTGNGARFDSAISDGTWHCFIISNGTTVAFGMSKSLTPTGEANYPSGYTHFRRIGSVIRSSGSILGFIVTGTGGTRKVEFKTVPALNFDTTLSTSPQTISVTVPTGIVVEAKLHGTIFNASVAGILYAYSPDKTDQAASGSAAPLAKIFGIVNNGTGNEFSSLTNASAQIKIVAAAASTTTRIATVGWTEFL